MKLTFELQPHAGGREPAEPPALQMPAQLPEFPLERLTELAHLLLQPTHAN